MLAFPATIYYSGDAPTEIEGLVQINFQIPPRCTRLAMFGSTWDSA
jgi:hypothetical protein